MHSLSISMPTTPASPTPSTPGAKVPAFPSMKPNALRIRTIRFGPFDVKTWYDAPFPEEYASIPDGRLWICEFCLKYMKSRLTAGRHKVWHFTGSPFPRPNSASICSSNARLGILQVTKFTVMVLFPYLKLMAGRIKCVVFGDEFGRRLTSGFADLLPAAVPAIKDVS